MDMSGNPAPCSTVSLVEQLYPELRRLARTVGWRHVTAETLRQTALVNETYLKLRRQHGFADEAHFLRTAAVAMRQVVINHARERLAAKRGGGQATISSDFDDVADDAPFWEDDSRLLALDQALEELRGLDPRLADIVNYRFFGGYSELETARLTGLSDRSVRREWTKAKAYLFAAIRQNEA
jgi:RNA polymerase sigma factor (TIGR02999 family)